MNCLSSMFKYLLYILNVIFVAGGILLIVVGSIMLSDIGSINGLDVVNTHSIPIIIIIIGCVTFVVAFFGCCGTIRENACCTTIYAVCMFILFALQLALSIWIFVNNTKFLNKMDELVDTAWSQNDSANGYPMDAIQLAFKCCGKTSYRDYENNVPASCCGYADRSKTCTADIYQYRDGCKYEFGDFWSSKTMLIRWSCLLIALCELVIFTIACCLASAMRRSR